MFEGVCICDLLFGSVVLWRIFDTKVIWARYGGSCMVHRSKWYRKHKHHQMHVYPTTQLWNLVSLTYFEAYARLYQWSTTSLPLSPHDTWFSSALVNILAWVCSVVQWGVCVCYIMVYKLTKVCTLTLVLSMLNSIFPLWNSNLKYPIVLCWMSSRTSNFTLESCLC